MTTAGTAVPLVATETIANAPVIVKALSGNAGLVGVGNDGAGDVASTNWFELSAGDVVVFDWVHDLQDIILDSASDGDGVSWLICRV